MILRFKIIAGSKASDDDAASFTDVPLLKWFGFNVSLPASLLP
ncbi:hypothetical protein CES85_3258 (plasmid) [Ochrobactrum quorumnocens]|uniref:Uncharacterized protein n=1 Tax=Ochrobactrum quorumnocens TaxID=271865 RepID=A0A248UP44_9HYPH|nr:hypothetical protein CES85_3258 [[Ochrobactrum] quorumnocens]